MADCEAHSQMTICEPSLSPKDRRSKKLSFVTTKPWPDEGLECFPKHMGWRSGKIHMTKLNDGFSY